ncbi:PP2C family protein-serine/threonine phosphatase [Yinghuangia sp. YIM S09857]|uniref:PP2C family protein-serine/threonine phosphatase n=1 Tax=Yinghuangia sp. YIM S09857 TaxID=3436929 RepID=UPI003F537875
MSTKATPDPPVAGGLGTPASPPTATWVRWAPFAVILLDVAFELALPTKFASGFLLIAVPVLAAFTRPPRTVAALVVLSLALEVLFAWRYDHFDELHHVGLYIATAIIGAVSVELARQRRRDARNLVLANSVAEALQLMLLRPVPPRLGPVRAAGYYEAADRRALVGGDLYDLVETPFGVRVVIGDVRGKGLPAIQHVGTVLGSFRDAAYGIADLAELADHMERRLVRETDGRAGAAAEPDGELFVTALLLEFPYDRREVHVVDRGHPAPILLSRGRVTRLATRPGVPLGLGVLADPAAGARSGASTHPLGPGEVLVLHTDGVSEARGPQGAFYPIEERLWVRFGGRDRVDPAVLAEFVRDDLADYSEGTCDDVALIALTRADSD